MKNFAIKLFAITMFLTVIGCGGYISTKPGTEVEVNGTVNGPDGKPLNGCMIFFQATGGDAQPAQFTLKDGQFSGKMISGKYTYYVEVPTTGAATDIKKAEAALKGVPSEWRKGHLDRQIDVSGGKIEIKF